jgi:hypothetical protein
MTCLSLLKSNNGGFITNKVRLCERSEPQSEQGKLTRTGKRGSPIKVKKRGSSLLLTHKLNPVTRFICPGRFEYNIQTHGIT